MRIFILAGEEQKKELDSIGPAGDAERVFASRLPGTGDLEKYDAFFFLDPSWPSFDFQATDTRPVFINSVMDTLAELRLPGNVSRINAWPGFLQGGSWEVATNDPGTTGDVFLRLGRKAIPVKDEPGLVAARIMSMIINEAFYALGENVSSREEIDLSMQSGTHYPGGPFEWADKLGAKNVYGLLAKLSERESRYRPAPALQKWYFEKNRLQNP